MFKQTTIATGAHVVQHLTARVKMQFDSYRLRLMGFRLRTNEKSPRVQTQLPVYLFV